MCGDWRPVADREGENLSASAMIAGLAVHVMCSLPIFMIRYVMRGVPSWNHERVRPQI